MKVLIFGLIVMFTFFAFMFLELLPKLQLQGVIQ